MSETKTFRMMAYYIGERFGSMHAGKPSWVDIRLDVETVEQARVLAAQFPKSSGVRAGTHHDSLAGITTGWLGLKIDLSPNGSNKGTNETGVKRYRSFVRACGKLGYEIQFCAPEARVINAYATREDFENAIS